jgi:mitochondrial import receptor subunit TOM40
MATIEKETPIAFEHQNALVSSIKNVYAAFGERRAALGLTNPGKAEDIHSEAQNNVFLTNQMFTGLRADLGKTLCASPTFSINHSFAVGSQVAPPYTFVSMLITQKVYLDNLWSSDHAFARILA